MSESGGAGEDFLLYRWDVEDIRGRDGNPPSDLMRETRCSTRIQIMDGIGWINFVAVFSQGCWIPKAFFRFVIFCGANDQSNVFLTEDGFP